MRVKIRSTDRSREGQAGRWRNKLTTFWRPASWEDFQLKSLCKEYFMDCPWWCTVEVFACFVQRSSDFLPLAYFVATNWGLVCACLIDFSLCPDWHSATNWRWQIEAKAGLGPRLKGINSGHGHPCVPPPAGIFTGELGRKKKTWCQSRWQRPRWSDSSAPPSDTCCTPPNICSIFPPRSISLGTNCTGGQAPQEGGRSWQWCGLEVWHCVRVAGSHGRHHARPRNPSGRLMGTGRSDAIPILGESGPSSS